MEEISIEKTLAKLVEKVDHKYYGKYRGIVVNNEDPEKLGRLKVKVPALLGNDVVTGWAIPCLPYGGAPDQGFFFIPEVDAGVWIEFENGVLEFPIWVGTFWSKPGGESELPKPNVADGLEQSSVQDPPTRKIIKTKKGHTIQLEDVDGEEMVTIVEATNGHVLTMNQDGIKIIDGANDHEIVLDSSGIIISEKDNQNTVALDQQGIEISDSNDNKISMTSSGVVVEGSQIKLGGEGASEPVVLGIKLLTWLATHTHPTSMGPSGPPAPPPTTTDFCSQQNTSL